MMVMVLWWYLKVITSTGYIWQISACKMGGGETKFALRVLFLIGKLQMTPHMKATGVTFLTHTTVMTFDLVGRSYKGQWVQR